MDAVRPLRAPGRRDPRDQALPPGQAGDRRHPRRAGREAGAGPPRSRRCSPTSRPAGRSSGTSSKEIAQRLRRRPPDADRRAARRRSSIREEDYIVDEDAWVIVTRDGWIKRQKSFADVAEHPGPRRRPGRLGLPRPGPPDAHLLHRPRHRLHPPGQRHPADDRPRRADPEALRLRGPRAHRRRRLPRPPLPARRSTHAPPPPPQPSRALLERRARRTLNGDGHGRRRSPPAPLRGRPDGRRQGPPVRARRPLAAVSTRKGRVGRPARPGVRRRPGRRRRGDRRHRERLPGHPVGPRPDLPGRRGQRRRRARPRGSRRSSSTPRTASSASPWPTRCARA